MKAPRHTGVYKYAVVDPSGLPLLYTLSDYKETAWSSGGFDHAANEFGEAWRSRYWHRSAPSIKAAMRRGYRFIKYELVEVD